MSYWQSPWPLTQFVTTNEPPTVRVKLPPVPVTVNALVPGVAAVVVVTVSVDVLPVVLLGLKVPVAPVPRPLTDSVTAEVNEVLVMVMV